MAQTRFQTMIAAIVYYSCCFSPQNNFHPTPWWVLHSVVDTIVPVQSNERRSRNWNSRAAKLSSHHETLNIHSYYAQPATNQRVLFDHKPDNTLRKQFWIDHMGAWALSN